MSEANVIKAMRLRFHLVLHRHGAARQRRCPGPSAWVRGVSTNPGRYVRELEIVSLERAIARMTSVAANDLKLYDRGRITPGAAADLVVFDADRVRRPLDLRRAESDGGGNRPRPGQRPVRDRAGQNDDRAAGQGLATPGIGRAIAIRAGRAGVSPPMPAVKAGMLMD